MVLTGVAGPAAANMVKPVPDEFSTSLSTLNVAPALLSTALVTTKPDPLLLSTVAVVIAGILDWVRY